LTYTIKRIKILAKTSVLHQEREKLILNSILIFLFFLCGTNLLIDDLILLMPGDHVFLFRRQIQYLAEGIQRLNLALVGNLLRKILNKQALDCYNLVSFYVFLVCFWHEGCFVSLRLVLLLLFGEQGKEGSLLGL